MPRCATLLIGLTVLWLTSPAMADPPFTLLYDTIGSAGGGLAPDLPGVRVDMTIGQAVVGMAAGPPPAPKAYAENVGFWHWGSLPVLDANDGQARQDLVASFKLYANAPNPFGRATTIRYEIPTSFGRTRASIRILDVSGRLVRELVSGIQPAGVHTVAWDGRNQAGAPVGTGIYFCRMEAGTFKSTRRLVLVR